MSRNEGPVKFNEFVDYLNSLKGEHICPMCMEEQWKLFTPDQINHDDDPEKTIIATIPGAFVKINKEKSSTLYRSPGLDVLLMECQNCGYINFFNHKKVSKNLKSGEYVKDSEGEDDASES